MYRRRRQNNPIVCMKYNDACYNTLSASSCGEEGTDGAPTTRRTIHPTAPGAPCLQVKPDSPDVIKVRTNPPLPLSLLLFLSFSIVFNLLRSYHHRKQLPSNSTHLHGPFVRRKGGGGGSEREKRMKMSPSDRQPDGRHHVP